MDDYSDAIDMFRNAAPRRAVADIDANPEDGARALQLSQSMGIPAPVVYGDLDHFDAKSKASMASELIRQHPALNEYINSNPLASVVSNDDYGNLAKFSTGAKQTQQLIDGIRPPIADLGDPRFPRADDDALHPQGRPADNPPGIMDALHEIASPGDGATPGNISQIPIAAIAGGIEGAIEHFDTGTPQSMRWAIDAWDEYPAALKPFIFMAGLAGSMGEDLINVLSALAGGTIGAAKATAGATAQVFGAGRDTAESFSRDIAGMVEMKLLSGEVAPEIPTRIEQAIRYGKPYLDVGEMPPRGLHPVFDEIYAGANAKVLDKMEADLMAAQESLTRERSPELFQSFVDQHYKDTSIGISADKVLELYGDKVPSPDDGLLGWVDGIGDKLAAARSMGEDIKIPLKDWIAKVDPSLAKALHDDIRMLPEGITATEAKEPIEPKEIVESPLAQVRGAANLEPMYMMGDRKLSLLRDVETEGYNKSAIGPAGELYHEYKMLDEKGNDVGQITLLPDEVTKTLHVEMISGEAGHWVNSFGPGLMRDIYRQAKLVYPNFEIVTGHRVTGARGKAGTTGLESAYPKVKLDDQLTIGSFQDSQKILNDAFTRQLAPGLTGEVRPTELLSGKEKDTAKILQEEFQRVVGGNAKLQLVTNLTREGGGRPQGAVIMHADQLPKIVVDLGGDSPVGTIRHEAIHILRSSGLISKAEWGALVKAAREEGWIERYHIDERYDHLGLDELQKLEEAIAEGYRDWAGNKEANIKVNTPTTGVFGKIKDFIDGVLSRIGELVGRPVTADEVFSRIHSSEVGGREGESKPTNVKFSEEDTTARMDNLKAGAVGLDIDSFKKLQGLIQERFKSDIEAATKRAEKEQHKTQTKEWKSNRAEMEKEVSENIRQRPDVAADLFVGSGELGGKKIKQRIPLAEDDLTAEQKASLPDHYYAKSGLPIDQVANLMGYRSGDAMVAKLAEYQKFKGELTPKEALDKLTKTETDRRMEAKYGKLDENVMSEARDQALSEVNLNILAEEYHAAGMQAGKVADKGAVKAEGLRIFSEMKVGETDLYSLMVKIGKHGRDAERALIAGKPAEALVSMQKKYMTAVIAAEVKKAEKIQAAFEKAYKTQTPRVIKNQDPQYTNYIHDIYDRVGRRTRQSVRDINDQIEGTGTGTLKDFVASKSADGRVLPVWDQLYDPKWKIDDIKNLTNADFEALHGTLTAMIFNAKNELKIELAGEKMDFLELRNRMVENLQRPNQIQTDAKGQPLGVGSKVPGIEALRGYYVKHLNMENIFGRFDRFDAHGDWSNLLYQLIDGANQKEIWGDEYRNKLMDIRGAERLDKTVDNQIWRNPDTDVLLPMTRNNLLAIMLNSGTKSNIEKMAGGYKLTPDQMMNWIHEHATEADWEFVDRIWKEIFPDIKSKGDRMSRSLTGGVAPENIPAQAVETKFGKLEGGYYPVIHHGVFAESPKALTAEGLLGPNYYSAMTPQGWTKSRTRDVRPLSLSLDDMPGRINQMLHDIAMRPAVINASKIFNDKAIKSAIRANYGAEFADGLKPYLEAVSNSANRMTKADAALETVSGFMRQNLIASLVGFNPGTVLKHGPSALITSIREVGMKNYLEAAKSLYSIDEATGESNHDFMMRNSLEMQRRDRNARNLVFGDTNTLAPGISDFTASGLKGDFLSLRNTMMYFGSKPVAFVDKLAAGPTWLAAYKSEIISGGSHGDAITQADRAVRRSHGSTAITNRSAIQRDWSPWLTSLYNFFSDIMNRQVETIWKAGDTAGLVKDKQYGAAMATVPGLTASVFAYALWPAIVENLVSPEDHDPKTSWPAKAAMGLGRTLASSWVGVRDIASAFMSGRDPQSGLIGTAYKSFTDFGRDLQKHEATSTAKIGKLLQDGSIMLGALTGMVGGSIGHVARYTHDVNAGLERPQGPWGWLVGLRYGTTQNHSKTFEQYMAGKH